MVRQGPTFPNPAALFPAARGRIRLLESTEPSSAAAFNSREGQTNTGSRGCPELAQGISAIMQVCPI